MDISAGLCYGKNSNPWHFLPLDENYVEQGAADEAQLDEFGEYLGEMTWK